ncbi:beta-lactamase domain protein [Kribbella flavida DSM 17836]|uniref:Beta-lactamase domain protein n=1 Tax=Kribbella flavida (strain DSM 17836 / JCM 10339 / NBRC 14399) TaxID=479435 RepID=D2PLI8_KRIFD|nr:MBL fold metallo-hydrolase [Kribbella flavida]ADB30617.1 beta-lactamase domain protein [Kribbella flavida DSM 17836]
MLNPAGPSRLTIGSTTVSYLPDGEVHLDPAALFPASGPDGWNAYAPYLDPDGRLPISVGSFLIRTGDHRVLVDLGLGAVDFEVPNFGSFKGGALLDSLAGEGLRPADIDTVVYTHLHHDHVGWTTDVAPAPGSPSGGPVGPLTFGNARHLVDSAEWDYWNGRDEVTGPDLQAVQKPLSAVVEFLDHDRPVVPGVRAIATAGHTPGHTSLLVTDPDTEQRLLILGDVMHTQAQISETDWNFLLDVDADEGTRTRGRVLEQYQDQNTLIAGGHFAGTVFGRFLPARRQYRWAVTTH